MTIRKFKVFTLDRIFIYLGVCFAFPLACFSQAIRYNYFQHSNGLPVPAWIAMIGALLGFTLGVYRLFWDRYVFKKQITGYTTDGIMVFMPTYKSALPAFDETCKQLETATKEVVDFWAAKYPAMKNSMLDLINGATLSFDSGEIPLDAPSNITGFQKFAVGITDFKYMLIMAKPEEGLDVVLPRFKHELGHVVLNAANIEQDSDYQHKIMKAAGFPY